MGRFIKAAMVAVVAIAGIGIAAAPGAASSGDCPSSYTCTWNGTNWSGTPAFKDPMPAAFGACVNVSSINGANNNADSVYNRNNFQVSFYNGANGSGYLFSLAANAGEGNLAVHPILNGQNLISSICHE
jgi:hypothetical protein